MKPIEARAAILYCTILLAACGSWQHKAAVALEATATGAIAAQKIARPVLRKQLLDTARSCTGAPCEALDKAKAKRIAFDDAVKKLLAGLNTARALLTAAIAADGGEGWQSRVMLAAANLYGDLQSLRQSACTLGVKALCGGAE